MDMNNLKWIKMSEQQPKQLTWVIALDIPPIEEEHKRSKIEIHCVYENLPRYEDPIYERHIKLPEFVERYQYWIPLPDLAE